MSIYKNILLINFGGIGDEILFLPVIQAIRDNYSDAKITLCLEGRSSAFIKLTSLLDSHFCIDIKTKNKYIEMLKLYFKALTGGYDLVISSGANPLISVFLFLTGIKTRIGYCTNSLSKKLLTHPVALNKNQYAANMYFDLAKPIINTEFQLPNIPVEEEDKLPDSILIHPGVSAMSVSKSITKTFSAEKWAELIILLLNKGKNVYLAGGPDDNECITKIREQLKGNDLTNFTDMFGKTKNIFDLVKLIKKSEILICSDSAPMHIGVATNTKTIAIFGPTDNKKLLPANSRFYATVNNADCRPCLWHKRQTTCKELKCLDINLQSILDFVQIFTSIR